MATFKSGSLTKDTYLEWIDTVQGHATDSGIWKFIDGEESRKDRSRVNIPEAYIVCGLVEDLLLSNPVREQCLH